MKRIFISGPSGTGKTTLAKHIAKEYNIPYIETSTKPIWHEFGVKSHEEIIKKGEEDIRFMLDFQHRVLQYRDQVLSGKQEFVTDRGALDVAVYYLMQAVHKVQPEKAEYYFARCAKLQNMATHQFMVPFTKEIKLENDGMRIANKHYQMVTQYIFYMALREDYMRMSPGRENGHIEIHHFHNWDWEKRVAQVNRILG